MNPFILRAFIDFYRLPPAEQSWREQFYYWRLEHPFWNCSGDSASGVLFCTIYGDEWWRRALIRPLYFVGNRIHRVKLWFMWRLVPLHRYHMINTGLTPGYYDHDTRILHGCMAMLGEFLKYDGHAENGSKSQARKIWEWWTVEKPADEKLREELLHAVYGNKTMEWKPTENPKLMELIPVRLTESEAAMNQEFRALEKKIAADEQAYLHRLINIRPTLWT